MSNVQPIVDPQPERMLKQLEHLFGGDLGGCHDGLIELAWNDADGDLNQAQFFGTDQFDELVELAVKLNREPGVNVFIGAALKHPHSAPFGRSSDNDAWALTAAYADVDDDVMATAKISYQHRGCPPTGVTVTGRTPHVRAQMYWRYREPLRDPDRWRAINRALAGALGADASVVNPGRLLRLAGSIAWPKKPGRILELTEWHQYDDPGRPRAYLEGQIVKAFPLDAVSSGSQTSATSTAPPPNGSEAARHAVSGRVDLDRTLRATRQAGHWHNNMVAAVASMVQRNWSDEQIRLACAPYCERGYHDPDLDPIIGTARRKWQQDETADEAVELPKLSIISPADLHGLPVPKRRWIVPEWLPAGQVTGNFGDGGVGKTLLVQMQQASAALGRSWLGLLVEQCPTLSIFCEDDQDELHRRQVDIASHLDVGLSDLKEMHWLSRVGEDNLLMTFSRSEEAVGEVMPLFWQVREAALDLKARVVTIDTIADTFGGNENNRNQVRQFVQRIGVRLARDIDGAVILNGHPSKAQGSEYSGSTAWDASVRSRWQLKYADAEEGEEPDRFNRVLAKRKANYSSTGDEMSLRWEEGVFLRTDRDVADTVDRIGYGARQRAACEVFLKGLDELMRQGFSVTAKPKSQEFAPRLMLKYPLAKGFKAGDLDKAMRQLMTDDVVREVPYGPPSKGRTRLERT